MECCAGMPLPSRGELLSVRTVSILALAACISGGFGIIVDWSGAGADRPAGVVAGLGCFGAVTIALHKVVGTK